MKIFRLTSRAGGCLHCGYTTSQACTDCEQFVCPNDEQKHDELPQHELIEQGRMGG